eukprot:TRINITY_DN20891_c0_g1_i1.p1 TRINITY_DN20891_c0_g1~~TRINITY_DN20891_c0_g1_i1.p1  ORF type:complete len:222 (-),score=17.93 TRINITY_DN20891_c0_g1_i1:195-860(-)
MHHLKNKFGKVQGQLGYQPTNGNLVPKVSQKKMGFGSCEISLERSMDSVKAVVGDVHISNPKEKKPDPYVICVVRACMQETRHQKNTNHAFFGESFVFPASSQDVMDVWVVDKDWLKDDAMFYGSIPMAKIPLGRKVTVHVRRDMTGTGTDIQGGAPMTYNIPANVHSNRPPLFMDQVDDVVLYVYDDVPTMAPAPAVVYDAAGPTVPVFGGPAMVTHGFY